MSNMSYCRFQNTLADLQDCFDAIYDLDGDLSMLSTAEKRAAMELIDLCNSLVFNYGYLLNEGD